VLTNEASSTTYFFQASQAQPESGKVPQVHPDGGPASEVGIQTGSKDSQVKLQYESSPYMHSHRKTLRLPSPKGIETMI